jgi:hypothetical protein
MQQVFISIALSRNWVSSTLFHNLAFSVLLYALLFATFQFPPIDLGACFPHWVVVNAA